MLASRVAHASAKGRSQQSGLPPAIVRICEARHENFSNQFPKAALRNPVRDSALSENDAHSRDLGTQAAIL
jgi:hypothetical protein